jgi:hypothetical protein
MCLVTASSVIVLVATLVWVPSSKVSLPVVIILTQCSSYDSASYGLIA